MCWQPLARKLQQRKPMSDKTEIQHTAESGLPGMTCSRSSATPEMDDSAYEATPRTVGKWIVPLAKARRMETERNQSRRELIEELKSSSAICLRNRHLSALCMRAKGIAMGDADAGEVDDWIADYEAFLSENASGDARRPDAPLA